MLITGFSMQKKCMFEFPNVPKNNIAYNLFNQGFLKDSLIRLSENPIQLRIKNKGYYSEIQTWITKFYDVFAK